MQYLFHSPRNQRECRVFPSFQEILISVCAGERDAKRCIFLLRHTNILLGSRRKNLTAGTRNKQRDEVEAKKLNPESLRESCRMVNPFRSKKCIPPPNSPPLFNSLSQKDGKFSSNSLFFPVGLFLPLRISHGAGCETQRAIRRAKLSASPDLPFGFFYPRTRRSSSLSAGR